MPRSRTMCPCRNYSLSSPSGRRRAGYSYLVNSSSHRTGDGRREAREWADGDEQNVTQFVIFLIGEAHSNYGYWLYGGRPLDEAPLVYLDSEAADSTVLANTLAEFVALVALGAPNLGLYRLSDEDVEPDEETPQFRDWLKAETGIAAPTDAEARAIIGKARAQQPDLEQWALRMR